MRNLVIVTAVTAATVLSRPVAAQQENTRLASATFQAKQKLGLIVFPAKNQTAQQQAATFRKAMVARLEGKGYTVQ